LFVSGKQQDKVNMSGHESEKRREKKRPPTSSGVVEKEKKEISRRLQGNSKDQRKGPALLSK